MELNPADLICDTQDERWAAAFGRWGHHESARTTAYKSWQLYCRSCLDKERQRSVANYEFEYVLLDPARQRRPDPDPDRNVTITVDHNRRNDYICPNPAAHHP